MWVISQKMQKWKNCIDKLFKYLTSPTGLRTLHLTPKHKSVLASGRHSFFLFEQLNKWTKYTCHPKFNSVTHFPEVINWVLMTHFPVMLWPDPPFGGSMASLPGMVFAIDHLPSIYFFTWTWDGQLSQNRLCSSTLLTLILRFHIGCHVTWVKQPDGIFQQWQNQLLSSCHLWLDIRMTMGRGREDTSGSEESKRGVAKLQMENHPAPTGGWYISLLLLKW